MKTSKTSGRKAMLLTLQLFFVVVLLALGVWIGSRPTGEASVNGAEASVQNTH